MDRWLYLEFSAHISSYVGHKIRLPGARSGYHSQKMFLINYSKPFIATDKIIEMRLKESDNPFKIPASDSPLKSNIAFIEKVLQLLR